MRNEIQTISVIGSSIVVAYFITKLLRENRDLKKCLRLLKYREKSKGPDTYIKTLFFPDNRIICRNMLITSCHDEKCSYSHDETAPLTQIIRLLQSATRTIDLALFEITSEELSETILQKLKCGVKVRLIVDSEYMMVTGTKVHHLTNAGCYLLHDHSTGLFHHKFAIIDETTVATGSLNWTRQAVIGNYENVVFIKHTETVSNFCIEYNRMWEKITTNMKNSNHDRIARLKSNPTEEW